MGEVGGGAGYNFQATQGITYEPGRFPLQFTGGSLALERGGNRIAPASQHPGVPFHDTTMAVKTVVNSVLLDGQKIVDTWTANPGFTLGEVTLKSFSELSRNAAQVSETIETKRIELQGLMNQRDDAVKSLRELIVRARSGFKATYGTDSTQYEQAGGTRSSERKPSSRKKLTVSGK